MTAIDTTTPRVWICCLHCYNDGALVGEWYDAIDADEVTVAKVHTRSARDHSQCEELWVMDHENIPVSGEMDLLMAAEWGRALTSVPEHQQEALFAWVKSGSYVAEGTGDLPSLPDFEERYEGEWCSWREYADHLLEEGGLLDGVSDEVRRYIDYDQWARDLLFDYTVEHCDDGGVFVFRDL
ncbi:antirestriction protein ArdA [Brachybacterium sp. UNK5269]|uniref:antirestriction protein ArdA n=1 Tax=Brachybacterium sp. UNK5269 TaxID=3408576 RepID=UPI003BAF0558